MQWFLKAVELLASKKLELFGPCLLHAFILYWGKVLAVDTGFREIGEKGAGFEAEDPVQGVLCQTTFKCSEAAPVQGCAEL